MGLLIMAMHRISYGQKANVDETRYLGKKAQSELDSLINLRDTGFIDGKLPTYYTPGYKNISLEFQKIATEAIDYYEGKYSKEFHVKLAVLDSVQWLKEIIPYGFVFYDNGWLVMNTGMDYETFKKIYGLKTYEQQLDIGMKKLKMDESEMMSDVFKVYSIHELGHYFINILGKAKSPDAWTGEFIATYFAYEFFKNVHPNELIGMELFSGVNRDFFSPKFSTIKDFDEKYVGVGLFNYVWYHSNFYFLAESLYGCKGKDFIPYFEKTFPKETVKRFTISEIIEKLDKECNGTVAKWAQVMESKTKE